MRIKSIHIPEKFYQELEDIVVFSDLTENVSTRKFYLQNLLENPFFTNPKKGKKKNPFKKRKKRKSKKQRGRKNEKRITKEGEEESFFKGTKKEMLNIEKIIRKRELELKQMKIKNTDKQKRKQERSNRKKLYQKYLKMIKRREMEESKAKKVTNKNEDEKKMMTAIMQKKNKKLFDRLYELKFCKGVKRIENSQLKYLTEIQKEYITNEKLLNRMKKTLFNQFKLTNMLSNQVVELKKRV